MSRISSYTPLELLLGIVKWHEKYRSQSFRVETEKEGGVLKNFAEITGKRLFPKMVGLR